MLPTGVRKMSLTAIAIKNAKPKSKVYKLSDSRGLCLEVTPSGSKRWRFRFRFGNKEQMISLGLYPDVSLVEARDKQHAARTLLSKGIHPSQVRSKEKEKQKGLESFESVALEWFEKNKHTWTENHAFQIRRRLEMNIFPWLGRSNIAEITPPELLKHLRRIESRGAIETAHRVKGCCGQVFRYAVATGRTERDITQDLRDALTPAKINHHATILEPKKIGALLKTIEEYEGYFVTKCAMRLAPLTFVRPGELRHAEWSEIDLEKSQWKIPANKMKARVTHIVPLSKQAKQVVEDIYPLTGNSKYVFPSPRSDHRPLSNNAVTGALRRMGYSNEEMTGHGFRSMASTLLNELGWKWDAIERQLAHSERNSVRAAYNYAEYLPERSKMMQAWADFLDQCKEKSNG
jgi:integrase